MRKKGRQLQCEVKKVGYKQCVSSDPIFHKKKFHIYMFVYAQENSAKVLTRSERLPLGRQVCETQSVNRKFLCFIFYFLECFF